MTSLTIDEASFPTLTGKVALITGNADRKHMHIMPTNARSGGSSGIGFAAAEILASKGASVHILDRNPPSATESWPPVTSPLSEHITFHKCDITDWKNLRGIFANVGKLDYVFANAGISETEDFLADTVEDTTENGQNGIKLSASDHLKEPSYPLLGVNLKAVLNVIKLAHHSFKRDGKQGSIVLTSSATAYAPEQSLPVYSAVKLALIGLIRSLRHNLICDGVTINAVVPACTETALVGSEFLGPIKNMGLPVSSARFVGAALVHSATATEKRKVDVYGKEPLEKIQEPGPWNGRVILTLGDSYTELEEKLADLRPQWFGEENAALTRNQQAVTDFRSI